MSTDRDLAERAARAGGAQALRLAGGELDVRSKSSPADLVSAADHASEDAIVALLRAERPEDAILGEEGARVDPTHLPSTGDSARRWLVDGLDGTVNFLRGIPQWCVAVVLEEGGEPLAGAVFDPVRGELFSAARGEGAHRDGVALRVREGAPLAAAVVSSFLRADKLRGTRPAPSFGRLAEAAGVLRMGGAGSLELAWLAAGKLDAWAQPNVDPWDWLPGRLLVEEAGGRTTVIDSEPLSWFLAAAPGTFAELEELLSAL
jgi:myo-inositol-1(or 4)-monophosphatase